MSSALLAPSSPAPDFLSPRVVPVLVRIFWSFIIIHSSSTHHPLIHSSSSESSGRLARLRALRGPIFFVLVQLA
ncbi:hypothetical protein PCANC_10679 [Puccinia coronata f. sp. avenae]|uniref:Uncharacterized protein n=1 Tax=Puccinia coronata f. sp. avenae TaxID=200324 RepID=A0A2N5SQS4_9BASI|nr:hypothetical protein PCANC_15831 [Puccinia coronata f. sp. avenae]PLW41286.1 hypothetical protein PCASD_10857 [Puccinia coronata f. sp. avenae]PLW48958.1 hypothetical protein PCANC_10679 [Puccinia coronata f. sp. avenae]